MKTFETRIQNFREKLYHKGIESGRAGLVLMKVSICEAYLVSGVGMTYEIQKVWKEISKYFIKDEEVIKELCLFAPR